MTPGSRSIRSRPKAGIAVSRLLQSALVAELLAPSSELWLVSGWVSNIQVIDNANSDFNTILWPGAPAKVLLADVLVELAQRGTNVFVVVREDDHNELFLGQLRPSDKGADIRIKLGQDLHEKVLCTDSWMLRGSMNFTWNGLSANEESVVYTRDTRLCAQERMELRQRWW